MNAQVITRLLVYSMAHTGLFAMLVMEPHWFILTMRWFFLAMLVAAVVFRMSDAHDLLSRKLLLEKKAFLIDWIPPLVVIPFCTGYAFQSGMMWEAGICSVYWISTLRVYRRMSMWKETMD